MGTRADFYYQDSKEKLHWLGSIGWDGYPTGIDYIFASTQKEYIAEVKKFLSKREDATLPKDGWPWPWETSNTTDYAYVFRKGKVYVSYFGKTATPLHDTLVLEKNIEAIERTKKLLEPNDMAVVSLGALTIRLEYAFEGLNRIDFKFPDMTSIQNISYGANSGLIVIGGAK